MRYAFPVSYTMPMGPLYCETGETLWFFTEPVNTLSNAFIIIAALASFALIRKHARGSLDLYALAAVLLATGVGSTLWHGTRIPQMLTLDVLPGILFLFLLTYLWMRRLYGPVAGGLGLLGLVGMVYLAGTLLAGLFSPGPRFLLPIFGGVTATAVAFVGLTYVRAGRRLAVVSAGVVAVALAAAFFRTIDLYTCAYIPFGTHFLWHGFLSCAAYLSIRLLILLGARAGTQ